MNFNKNQPNEEVFTKYTLINSEVVETDSDDKSYAKCSDRSFFIKYSDVSGELFNPWGILNVAGEISLKRGGTPKYSWKRVNKTAFSLYMDFLSTHNAALLEATRGAI